MAAAVGNGSHAAPARAFVKRLAVLLGGVLVGTVVALAAVVDSHRVTLTSFMEQARPELVPLPQPRVWNVPAPAMMPGRLQQILKGVSSLDSELRHFNIKTGDWQELMTVSLKHARTTVKDLQLQSKRAGEVKDQVKAFLGSPGPKGARGPQGLPGPRGVDGGMGDVGDHGPDGNAGDPGVMGSAGSQGPVGLAGNRGKLGMAGKAGRNGISGATGYQGSAGAIGKRGRLGKPGDHGLIGPAGMDVVGVSGNQGIPGPTGEGGRPGPPGPEGSEGLQGNIGIRGKWGFPGTQGTFGEVQGQIWDPLTWNLAGPASPREVGRRDGGGGWNEYSGYPAYQARRGPRVKNDGTQALRMSAAKRVEAAVTKEEDKPSLYPNDTAKVYKPKPKRLTYQEWWEKQEAKIKALKAAGPKRVGCEGSTTVEDLTNDSMYVACNSMGKDAAIQISNMGSGLLSKVESAHKVDGSHTDSPREMVMQGDKVVDGDNFRGEVRGLTSARSRRARDVRNALNTFQSITIRDDDAFANKKVVDLDRNGNPKDLDSD